MLQATFEYVFSVRTARKEWPAPADSAVPRHLAMVLNARDAATFESACHALDAIINGCMESGVAALTLLKPENDIELFDDAMKYVRNINPRLGRDPRALQLHDSTARDGKAELLDAMRYFAAHAQFGELSPEQITAGALENALSTESFPPVDLLIQTGGGAKLSGALLWQCAYAELLFLDTPWHEFRSANFESALADFAQRSRKFGGLK